MELKDIGDKVTRLEVIEYLAVKGTDRPDGRVYVHWDENTKVELSLQDEGRTLKIFIKRKDKKETDEEWGLRQW